MMYFLVMSGALAGGVAMILLIIRAARRRPHLHSNPPTEQLGTVSQQWLTAHRPER